MIVLNHEMGVCWVGGSGRTDCPQGWVLWIDLESEMRHPKIGLALSNFENSR